MKLHATLLAAACALALAACGDDSRAPDTAAPPASTPDATAGTTPGTDDATTAPDAGYPAPVDGTAAADGTTPADGTAAAPGDTATADAQPAAGGCSVDVEGNDQMQYNVSSITVPSSCAEFTINLTHVGRLPEAAMGHNVVVTSTPDMAGVAADGISAGASAGYLKAGDERVIAATEMIGGGESTSVTFDVAKIRDGGPYSFFCSFPGHAALMKGTISVN